MRLLRKTTASPYDEPEAIMHGVRELTEPYYQKPRPVIATPQPNLLKADPPQPRVAPNTIKRPNEPSGSRQIISIIGQEFFQASLVTYLLLTLAETLREGFVSNFFNMNYLLLVVLISGVAMVLTEPRQIIPRLHKRASRATIVLAVRTYKREQAAARARQSMYEHRQLMRQPRRTFINM